MRPPDLVFRYLGHSERMRQRALQPDVIVAAPLERSLRPSTSFILRFKRLCLSLEKNLDSICSPHRDASTEKIRIFGPHCACQSECCGEDWPITFDNNAVERALRTVALGRKNFLFCGSDAGGERAPASETLLGAP